MSEKWIEDLARELRILYGKVMLEAPEYVPTVTDGVLMIERALESRPVQQPATEGDEIYELLKTISVWEEEYRRINNLGGSPEWVGRLDRALAARHVPVGTGPDEEAEFKNWAFPADGDGTRLRNFAAYGGAHDGWMARAALAVRAVPVGTGWISVEERLPEFGQDVLALSKSFRGCTYAIAFVESDAPRRGLVRCSDGSETEATHWQPLPASPLAHSPEAKEERG